jgi:hypothetical protein
MQTRKESMCRLYVDVLQIGVHYPFIVFKVNAMVILLPFKWASEASIHRFRERPVYLLSRGPGIILVKMLFN